MAVAMNIAFSSLAIPLATFVLGVLSSYVAQKYWRRRDLLRRHVEAIVVLTADWYDQLLRLHTAELAGKLNREQVEEYVRGRLILPKLLYSIGVLHERNAYPELRDAARDFLEQVTFTKPISQQYSAADWFDHRNCVALCIDHYAATVWSKLGTKDEMRLTLPQSEVLPVKFSKSRDQSLGRMLSQLDEIQQRITRLATRKPD